MAAISLTTALQAPSGDWKDNFHFFFSGQAPKDEVNFGRMVRIFVDGALKGHGVTDQRFYDQNRLDAIIKDLFQRYSRCQSSQDYYDLVDDVVFTGLTQAPSSSLNSDDLEMVAIFERRGFSIQAQEHLKNEKISKWVHQYTLVRHTHQIIEPHVQLYKGIEKKRIDEILDRWEPLGKQLKKDLSDNKITSTDLVSLHIMLTLSKQGDPQPRFSNAIITKLYQDFASIATMFPDGKRCLFYNAAASGIDAFAGRYVFASQITREG